MKQIRLFASALFTVFVISSCSNPGDTFNFPVENSTHQEDHHGHEGEEKPTGEFGEKISETGAISGKELLTQLSSSDSVVAKVKAPILHACQKKGCWMIVDLEGTEMRVTFKDYGFFVPKNSDGHTAIMEGKAYKELISVETLRHYAEDEGKTKEEIAAITEPVTEYSFEAVGVIIK
ncbi:MAG: DUF4920 domain-containing protein [Flavobacteriales bacterium]|nr:DUF4920 domain-containing protein [Flavobacteriales bacterium]